MKISANARPDHEGQASQSAGIPELAAILRRGHAELMRYLVPYNRQHSREQIEDAARLLLARLLFIRSLEARRIEQPQLAPVLRGWQRIGRRRDLLALLSGVVRTLERFYAGPLLAPALLDRLECEPTPLEPVLEALLDQAHESLLADPLALALAWELAFASAPPPWPAAAVPRLLDLALPPPGRRGELPAVLTLGAGGGALQVALANHLSQAATASARNAAAPPPAELLAATQGYEPNTWLCWGAILAVSLATLQQRARLPRTAAVATNLPARLFDAVLLYPASAAAGPAMLEQAAARLQEGGRLGLLLPAEADESPAWELTRQALFAGWSCETLLPHDGWMVVAARPEPDAARRRSARIAVGHRRRGAGTLVRQGALMALQGAPLRLELTEHVERTLRCVAAGRPLAEVAQVRQIKPDSPPPERGSVAVRARLPLLLLRPCPTGSGWQSSIRQGWPAEGGIAIQPLAELAEHKGSGVRLAPEERAALMPYSLQVLQAVLQSRLLAVYRRLILGRQGLPALDELRRLPVPRIAAETSQAQLAALEAPGLDADRQEQAVEILYGVGDAQ